MQEAAIPSPAEADVFAYSDPTQRDILSVAGGEDSDRRQWKVWSSRPSEIEGCTNLFDPKTLRPRVSLRSPAVPILALLDTLAEQGWIGEPRVTYHDHDTDLVYDSRRVSGKRFYLQRMLALPELLRGGAVRFNSIQPSSYYKCLLQGKEPIPPGQGAKVAEMTKSIRIRRVPGNTFVPQHHPQPEPHPPARYSRPHVSLKGLCQLSTADIGGTAYS